MDIEPNTIIKDRYRIVMKLGKGGMGVVYLAVDLAVDRQVAIKVNLDLAADAITQFEKEAKMLARIRHPNLPLVSDHFTIGESQYLVMDYVPGDTLSNAIKKKGAYSEDEVKSLAKQIGNALSYLHQQTPPIIHRDVKPSNIKIMPSGEAILVDFGIAKSTDETMTATGAQGYSPGYAPPEQYGSATTGPYSDQYSLAATLYAMLTTESPTDAIERMFSGGVLKSLKGFNSQLPNYMVSALERAMSINPEERFQNINDFVDSLTDPNYSASTILSPTIMRPKKKSRLGVIIGGLAIVVIALGTWFGIKLVGGATSSNTEIPVSAELRNTEVATLFPTATKIPTLTSTPIPTEAPLPTNTPTIEPTPLGAGGEIAFVSDRGDSSIFQIYTISADGSNLAQLTFDDVSKSQPVWSPDGQFLLYVADGGRIGGEKMGLDIWIINADGSNPVNLSQSIGDDYDPVWHPEGEKIAFVSTRVQGFRQIFFMDKNGGNQKFITLGFGIEYYPAWSPDGVWLAFSVSFNGSYPQLWLRNQFGQDPKPFDVSTKIKEVVHPRFSPDGKYIAYVDVKPTQTEIYLVIFETKGFDIFPLTNSLGNRTPSWSPDSQWLVFSSTRDLNSEIYIMDTGGRFQTNITNHEATDKMPSWRPIP